MATFLYRLGRPAFRRRWYVALLWGAVPAAVGFGAATAPAASDDGTGTAPTAPAPGHGYGLIGMRERAKKLGGQLEVWSKPGAGTEIDLRVPAQVAYRRMKTTSRG